MQMDSCAGGRSVYSHVIAKFSQMGNLPHFLTHGAPLHALCAQELHSYFYEFTCVFALKLEVESSLRLN